MVRQTSIMEDDSPTQDTLTPPASEDEYSSEEEEVEEAGAAEGGAGSGAEAGTESEAEEGSGAEAEEGTESEAEEGTGSEAEEGTESEFESEAESEAGAGTEGGTESEAEKAAGGGAVGGATDDDDVSNVLDAAEEAATPVEPSDGSEVDLERDLVNDKLRLSPTGVSEGDSSSDDDDDDDNDESREEEDEEDGSREEEDVVDEGEESDDGDELGNKARDEEDGNSDDSDDEDESGKESDSEVDTLGAPEGPEIALTLKGGVAVLNSLAEEQGAPPHSIVPEGETAGAGGEAAGKSGRVHSSNPIKHMGYFLDGSTNFHLAMSIDFKQLSQSKGSGSSSISSAHAVEQLIAGLVKWMNAHARDEVMVALNYKTLKSARSRMDAVAAVVLVRRSQITGVALIGSHGHKKHAALSFVLPEIVVSPTIICCSALAIKSGHTALASHVPLGLISFMHNVGFRPEAQCGTLAKEDEAALDAIAREPESELKNSVQRLRKLLDDIEAPRVVDNDDQALKDTAAAPAAADDEKGGDRFVMLYCL